jgi:hypothetical protein
MTETGHQGATQTTEVQPFEMVNPRRPLGCSNRVVEVESVDDKRNPHRGFQNKKAPGPWPRGTRETEVFGGDCLSSLPFEWTECNPKVPSPIRPGRVSVQGEILHGSGRSHSPHPAEGKGLPFDFRPTDGVIQVEPVNQEGHPFCHRTCPKKKNPPGRDPRGPGEPRWTARGGMFEKSGKPEWKSRLMLDSSPSQHPTAIPSPFPSILSSLHWHRGDPTEGKMAVANGHFDGRMGRWNGSSTWSLMPPSMAAWPWTTWLHGWRSAVTIC